MISWQTYAVLLVPGLGLYACGHRRLAALVWIALAVASQFSVLFFLCAAAALQLLCMADSLLRHE